MNEPPRLSLVIPAWNEAKYLPRLLDTVDVARDRFRGGADAVEVIVADNDSTDETAAIATDRGCRVVHVAKRCIAASRNGGAALARGDVVCFCDADFRIHADTFNVIGTIMDDDGYVGGATGLLMERRSLGIAITLGLAMALFRPLRLDGGIWFIRRHDFEILGGYDESVRCSEDARFLFAMRRLGRARRPKQRMADRKTAREKGLEPAMAMCSTRKFDSRGDWHMLKDMPKAAWWFVAARHRMDEHIEAYWYADER